MRTLILAASLLACACSQPAETPADAASARPDLAPAMLPIADGAGNRIEAPTQNGDRWCSEDGAWCVQIAEGATEAVVSGQQAVTLPMGGAVWPNVVRLGSDGALLGVVTTDEQMYSGGGGSSSRLTLYEISGGAARETATLPLHGAAMTRACFDEDDIRQRAEACNDEYAFVTRISIDQTVASGAPKLTFETAAGSFPGRVTRQADSLENAPLTDADLVWWRDEACSYRRVFTRGADGRYMLDQPLPACTDYLDP